MQEQGISKLVSVKFQASTAASRVEAGVVMAK
jgi:hypothetical protein